MACRLLLWAGCCSSGGRGAPHRPALTLWLLLSHSLACPLCCTVAAPRALQALGAMLAADSFARQLSDLEQLAVILAAAVHDVGHPGVNNDFLIRTQSEVGAGRRPGLPAVWAGCGSWWCAVCSCNEALIAMIAGY